MNFIVFCTYGHIKNYKTIFKDLEFTELKEGKWIIYLSFKEWKGKREQTNQFDVTKPKCVKFLQYLKIPNKKCLEIKYFFSLAEYEVMK